MQRKGNKKWGTLDEESKNFNAGGKRKCRKLEPELTKDYWYFEYGWRYGEDDDDDTTFSLEEYQQYLAAQKANTSASTNNNNNNKNKNNNNNNNVVSISGMSKEKVAKLQKAHLSMLGTADGKTNTDAATIPTLITAFEYSLKKKDYKDLSNRATMYLRNGMKNWTEPQITSFARTVIATNDHKAYDCIFLTRGMHVYHHRITSSVLAHLYSTSITDADKENFYDVCNYFLDLGSRYFGSILELLCRSMINKRDLKLLEVLLNHEALYASSDWQWTIAFFAMLELGDVAVPFIERLLQDYPTLVKCVEPRAYPNPAASPLFFCAKNGHAGLVEVLLNHKADPHFKLGNRKAKTSILEVCTNDKIKQMVAAAAAKKPARELGGVGSKALKRIMRDWMEIMRDPPSESVRAFPDEKNMFKWHVVITPPDQSHPLAGCNFHFMMEFPMNYPDAPPHIKGDQYLPHPNYFGGYLCLNMLRHSEMGKYSGWSSGYSAGAILMQLQAFLFDEEIDQDYGYTAVNKISKEKKLEVHKSCIAFKCKICGFNTKWRGYELDTIFHTIDNVLEEKFNKVVSLPYLGAPDYGQIDDPSTWENKRVTKKPISDLTLLTLPDYALLEVLDYLVRIEDLLPALKTCRRIMLLGEKYHIWNRRELICFYSKVGFNDDVLGVGLSVERAGGGRIKTISSPLDLLSRTTFFHDYIRKSSWQEDFSYWLPLVINEKHSTKAMPYLQATIAAIIYEVNFDVTDAVKRQRAEGEEPKEEEDAEERLLELSTKFQPLMVLDVIPKLMNHTIVAMMRDTSDGNTVFLHHSEKALLGYCSYHHILLEMCRRYPEVQKKIDHVLEQFCRHESARVKLAQPDLGELLVYLSVASKVTWKHIGQVFTQELLDRNVVWIFDNDTGKGHGELAYLEDMEVSNYRLNTTMNSSITGLRLLMFQVFFLEKVGRPHGKSPSEVLKNLNSSYGMPPIGIPTLLQRTCEAIYKVNNWPDFFARIGLACPSKPHMTTILRQAVMNSERKGYHVNRMEPKKLFDWRKKVDSEFAKTNPVAPAENGNSQSTHAQEVKAPAPTNATAPSPAQAKTQANAQNNNNAQAKAPANAPANAQKSQAQSQKTHTHDAHAQQPPKQHPVKIFVGNLSYRVTALDLEYVFQQFGKLVSSQVMYDEKDQSRGFGFIEVENEDVATTLLEFMQGADVDKRPVRLEKVDRNRPFKPRADKPTGTSKPPSSHPPASHPPSSSHSHSSKSNSNSHTSAPSQKAPQQKQQKNTAKGQKNASAQNPFANLDEE